MALSGLVCWMYNCGFFCFVGSSLRLFVVLLPGWLVVASFGVVVWVAICGFRWFCCVGNIVRCAVSLSSCAFMSHQSPCALRV